MSELSKRQRQSIVEELSVIHKNGVSFVNMIKLTRAMLDCGLKQAKELVWEAVEK